MHVPEVQRPYPGASPANAADGSSLYLDTHTGFAPTDGRGTSARPGNTMIPGGFAYYDPHQHDHQHQPRTALDYQSWVDAYQVQQQQAQQHAAQQHLYAGTPTPGVTPGPYQHQQSYFPGTLSAGSMAALGARQPRDSLGDLPPRIGGARASPFSHGGASYGAGGDYHPGHGAILTATEHATMYGGIADAPSAGTFDDSGAPLLSPGTSMSPMSDPTRSALPPVGTAPLKGKPRAKPRKRARRGQASDSEDSEGDDMDRARPSATDPYGGRLPGACTHCKKLKMKCDFPPDATVCKRCKSSGHQCVVEGRKPRSAPNKREYLMAQLRQKDAVIESLLKRLHNPFVSTPLSIANYRSTVDAGSPDAHSPNVLAWLERLKATQQVPAPATLTPGDALAGGAVSDGESTGASGENGDTGSSAAGEGLVDGERLIPDQTVPVGLFANLSLSATRRSTRVKAQEAVLANPDAQNEDDVGVANETYFMPGPATDLRIRQRLLEQTSPPEILVHGLVTPEDVDQLFDIFFKRMNLFFPLLDPVLHTPASTFSRCPFLFTVICAISSRFHPSKAEIYPIAMHFAKSEASSALIHGWKSVELCQAYMLMAVYGPPARRWEEDRGWIFTGLALRVAMDLNMHVPPAAVGRTGLGERPERERLNRMRAWMICYNMDRSTGTQFGKPCTIRDEYIECFPADFYKMSQYNSPYDVQMCAYNGVLKIIGQMHTELRVGGGSVNKTLDLGTLIPQYDARLQHYHDEWHARIEDRRIPDDPVYELRAGVLPFSVAYSRLVLHSFAFQQAYVRGVQPSDQPILMRCLDAATAVLDTFITRLAPSGYMRYSPDGFFLMTSFASAFLFKLLRPQFKALVSAEQETDILELIGRIIQSLSSPDIAIDDRHTPKVYARFLAGLLSRHRREGGASFALQINPPPGAPLPGPSPPAPAYDAVPPTTHAQGGSAQYGGYANQSGGGFATQLQGLAAPGLAQTHGSAMYAYPAESDAPVDSSFEDNPLASMQALRNPDWWDQMMMPGFTWPHSPATSSNGGFPASSAPPPQMGGYSLLEPISMVS